MIRVLYVCVSGVVTHASARLLWMSPHRRIHLLLAALSINSTGYLSSSCFAWLPTQVCAGLLTSLQCVFVCVGSCLICHLLRSHDRSWQMCSITHQRRFECSSVFWLGRRRTHGCPRPKPFTKVKPHVGWNRCILYLELKETDTMRIGKAEGKFNTGWLETTCLKRDGVYTLTHGECPWHLDTLCE